MEKILTHEIAKKNTLTGLALGAGTLPGPLIAPPLFMRIFWDFGLFIYICKMLRIFNTNFLANFIFLTCELYIYIYLSNNIFFMLQPQKLDISNK